MLGATLAMLCRGCTTFSVRIIDPFTCLGPEIGVTFGGAGFRSRCDTCSSLALDLRECRPQRFRLRRTFMPRHSLRAQSLKFHHPFCALREAAIVDIQLFISSSQRPCKWQSWQECCAWSVWHHVRYEQQHRRFVIFRRFSSCVTFIYLFCHTPLEEKGTRKVVVAPISSPRSAMPIHMPQPRPHLLHPISLVCLSRSLHRFQPSILSRSLKGKEKGNERMEDGRWELIIKRS